LKVVFLNACLGKLGDSLSLLIEHIHSATYHGNPIEDGKSLVRLDYGVDFDDLIKEWLRHNVSTFVIRDRHKGIDGEFLGIFVLIKDRLDRIGSILST